jgi:glycosyltransferase involved in cell wall biosynthesis
LGIAAPRVTIVTVVLNDERHITSTIRSVLDQTYKNKEYIVIDGGSTDGTLAEITKHTDAIDILISESDKGIYDAMNKAIRRASGDWITFLNSGDRFFQRVTLERVFSNSHDADIKIVYGDTIVAYPSGRTAYRNAGGVSALWRGSQFCHQSVLVRLPFHTQHEFSLSDGMAADFGFFYRAWLNGISFRRLDYPLSVISSGGVSDSRRLQAIAEWSRLVQPTLKSALYFRYRTMREYFAMSLKRFLIAVRSKHIS